MKSQSLHRVVVTGAGLVTPLATGRDASWQRLCAGEVGINAITHFDAADYTCKVAGEVNDFNADDYFDVKEQKRMDRFIQLGMVAADEALKHAGLLDMPDEQKDTAGVILGSGIGGLPATEAAAKTLAERGPSRISPFFIPSMLPNMFAGQVSMKHGWRGANVCPVTACATGTHAIGDAYRLIQRGELHVALAGGAEACVCPLAVAGFGAARALSTSFNDAAATASRPFDASRDGFVMGEGAGVLVLESLESATARGATILAELVGFGQTADAYHMTMPREDGASVQRAMQMAVTEAGIQGSDIDYVNAHATSTPAGDVTEANSIVKVCGENVKISGTKGATGHLLGAAGAIEAVFSVLSLVDQMVPPTANLKTPDPALPKANYIAGKGEKAELNYVLSNSFGFGGTNATLLFRRFG